MPIGFINGKLVVKFLDIEDELDIEETHIFMRDEYDLFYYSNGAVVLKDYYDGWTEYRYECDEPTHMTIMEGDIYLFWGEKCTIIDELDFKEGQVEESIIHIDDLPYCENLCRMADDKILCGDYVYHIAHGIKTITEFASITGNYIIHVDYTVICLGADDYSEDEEKDDYNTDRNAVIEELTDHIGFIRGENAVFGLLDGRYYQLIAPNELATLFEWIADDIDGNFKFEVVESRGRVVDKRHAEYVRPPPKSDRQVKSA